MDVKLRIVLPPESRAPSVARAWLSGLGSSVPDNIADDVRLLVTELVTNAVKYAGLDDRERMRLDIRCEPDRVEVMLRYEEHNGFEASALVSPGDVSGWGLFLVDRIADHWSIVQTNGVLEAWFEVELPSRSAA